MPHLTDPCPFCASMKTDISNRYASLGFSVECGECGAVGPFKSRAFSGKQLSDTEAQIAAVNAWNSRATR